MESEETQYAAVGKRITHRRREEKQPHVGGKRISPSASSFARHRADRHMALPLERSNGLASRVYPLN